VIVVTSSSAGVVECAPSTLLTPVCSFLQGLLGPLGPQPGGLLTGLLGPNVGIGVSGLIIYSNFVTCPAGRVAVGGGGSTGTLAGLLAASAPTSDAAGDLAVNGQTPVGWRVIDTGISTLTAYAICAAGS
jgi:hypothetical protein